MLFKKIKFFLTAALLTAAALPLDKIIFWWEE